MVVTVSVGDRNRRTEFAEAPLGHGPAERADGLLQKNPDIAASSIYVAAIFAAINWGANSGTTIVKGEGPWKTARYSAISKN